MNEKWDIHSSQRPSLRQFIDVAKRDYEVAMQALEPDPNADPLTYLDQQWAKESVTYSGLQRSQFGIAVKEEPRPGMMIGIMLGSVVFLGAFGLLIGRTNPIGLFCISLFGIIWMVLIGFGLRHQLRFAKAQKAYLAKRAQLITQLGLRPDQVPPAPVVEKPIIHQAPSLSAASQIRQLQSHYFGIQDQEQYQRSVKSIIAHAPEHERDYLRGLAAIEAEWVQARLKYIKLENRGREQRIPRPANLVAIIPICVLFGGVAIIQYAAGGHLLGLFGGITISGVLVMISVGLNQQAKQYQELEAYYAEKRNQLDSRFRGRAPF